VDSRKYSPTSLPEFADLNVGEAETSKAALELVMTQDWDIVLDEPHFQEDGSG
jgi:hypothetical protein